MKPLKVKIINQFTQNITAPSELQINEWLAANPGIDIIKMVQSESMVVLDCAYPHF